MSKPPEELKQLNIFLFAGLFFLALFIGLAYDVFICGLTMARASWGGYGSLEAIVLRWIMVFVTIVYVSWAVMKSEKGEEV